MKDKGQNKKIRTWFLENRSHVVNALLVLVDILAISLSVLLSACIRYLLEPVMGGKVNWPLIFNGLVFYVILTLIMAWNNELYPGFGLASVHEMQKTLYVVTLSNIFFGVLLFLQQLAQAYSRMIFLMGWVLSALLMMVGRFALRNIFSRFKWWGIPMAVIGSREHSEPVIEKMIKNRRLGFRPVCLFDIEHSSTEPIFGVPVVNTLQELTDCANKYRISHAVFAEAINDNPEFDLHWMRDVFPNILFVFKSDPFGSLWVQTIDLHGTLVIETNYHLLNKREMIIKRILDMFLTFLMLLVSVPIFGVLAILIKLDSKGPILYKQKRLGLGGELFDTYKFRTMYENAEEKLEKLLQEDSAASEEYEIYHKLSNDPRITRVGKFIRRYSLDELPQLINILKGDSNLIGPRSYLPRELPEMGKHANIILKVKPGITGWWQVMGRNATSFEERLKLDEYYISNWSIWLDIYIVIKTIWVLISGQGL